MQEEWKTIKEYENYEISNTDNVRNVSTQKILTKTINHDGYCYICLSKDNIQRKFSLHRLVDEAFIPNPDNLPEVDHIDRNKSNNNINNLRLVSHSTKTFNREYRGNRIYEFVDILDQPYI
jgi:hypothetical protein